MIKNNVGLGYQDVIPKFPTKISKLQNQIWLFFWVPGCLGYQVIVWPVEDRSQLRCASAATIWLKVLHKAWSCQAYASMHCGCSDFCRASSQLVQLIETLLPPGLTAQMHPLMAAWQVAFGVHAWHCHFLVAQTHWNLSQSWWSRTKKCYSASYPTKPVAHRTASAPWCAQNENMGRHTLGHVRSTQHPLGGHWIVPEASLASAPNGLQQHRILGIHYVSNCLHWDLSNQKPVW